MVFCFKIFNFARKIALVNVELMLASDSGQPYADEWTKCKIFLSLADDKDSTYLVSLADELFMFFFNMATRSA